MALTLNVRAAKKFADAEGGTPDAPAVPAAAPPPPVTAPVTDPTPEPAEGTRHDQYPVKLTRGRVAYLTLPANFGEADVAHLVKWVRLIAKHATP